MTRSEIIELTYRMIQVFNDWMPMPEPDTATLPFSKENIAIGFFTRKNCVDEYEEFCKESFPTHLESSSWKSVDFFNGADAMSLLGKEKNGILFNIDSDVPDSSMPYVVAHELSHLYCLQTEMPIGKHFIDIYRNCTPDSLSKENPQLDGCLNAGHTIWREFIADVMVRDVFHSPPYRLQSCKRSIISIIGDISSDNPNSKLMMSLLLERIFLSKELLSCISWDEAVSLIDKLKFLSKPNKAQQKLVLYDILKLVFEHFTGRGDDKEYWEIDEDFIEALGSEYIQYISFSLLKKFGSALQGDV